MSDPQQIPQDKTSQTKPSADSGPELRDHIYDGIQEFDNKLPNWWLWTFYIMVILYVIYWMMYYQGGGFKSDEVKIEQGLKRIAQIKAAAIEDSLGVVDNAKLWELSRDEKFVSDGRVQYMQMCSACHGDDLTAMRGEVKLPGVAIHNNQWLYGGQPEDVMEIIVDGSPDKKSGMQAWGPIIGEDKIIRVVAFIMSHHEEGAPIEEFTKEGAKSPTAE